MKKIITAIILYLLLGFVSVVCAKSVTISSLKELSSYAHTDGNKIRLKPGIYKISDFLTADSIAAKLERKDFQYFNFRGNNNYFDLRGVEFEIDTKLRELLKYPIHTNEIIISGNSNTFVGLNIRCIGDGLSPGGATLEVSGENNTIKDFKLWIKGSFPYGYGDLFGKGGPDVISHKKQSGFLVTGSYTNVYRCKLFMQSFGHGFFIQKDAGNIYFEDCYVEGNVRSTDDVLAETSGPAFDVKFRTWTPNREGEYIVTPGYMKSLCEDGFRTYGQNKNIRFKNCTAKNTRGGFELRTNGGVDLDGCEVIGVERGFWFGNNAIAKNCKGDAMYGPILFLEGSNTDIEIEVLSRESDRKVHALATIQGNNNKVILKSEQGKQRMQSLLILVGYTHPEHGEAMSPYGFGACSNLELYNSTNMPIVISDQTKDCSVHTNSVVEDGGTNNIIKYLK